MLRGLVRARLIRGVLQGNAFWVTIGSAVVARRLVRRLGTRPSEVVFRGEIRPGETLTISHLTEVREVVAP